MTVPVLLSHMVSSETEVRAASLLKVSGVVYTQLPPRSLDPWSRNGPVSEPDSSWVKSPGSLLATCQQVLGRCSTLNVRVVLCVGQAFLLAQTGFAPGAEASAGKGGLLSPCGLRSPGGSLRLVLRATLPPEQQARVYEQGSSLWLDPIGPSKSHGQAQL